MTPITPMIQPNSGAWENGHGESKFSIPMPHSCCWGRKISIGKDLR